MLAKATENRAASGDTSGRPPGKAIGALRTSRATAIPAAVSASARCCFHAATTAIGKAGRSSHGVRLWTMGSGPMRPKPRAWVMASAPIAATASHPTSQTDWAQPLPAVEPVGPAVFRLAVTSPGDRPARPRPPPRHRRRRGPARAWPWSGRCARATPVHGRRGVEPRCRRPARTSGARPSRTRRWCRRRDGLPWSMPSAFRPTSRTAHCGRTEMTVPEHGQRQPERLAQRPEVQGARTACPSGRSCRPAPRSPGCAGRRCPCRPTTRCRRRRRRGPPAGRRRPRRRRRACAPGRSPS